MADGPTLFFGIGAQKSGTTWIYNHLHGHRDVFVPDVKETNFFWARQEGREEQEIRRLLGSLHHMLDGRDPATGPVRQGRGRNRIGDAAKLVAALSGRADYLDLYAPRGRRVRAMGEISPAYAMLSEETFRAMAGLTPDVRFFFVMRDPVARFWSSVRMLVTRQPDTLTGTTVQAVFERMLSSPDSHLRRMTDYGGTLDRLHRAVPDGKVHCLFYEDLFSDRAEKTVRGLETFLGIGHRVPKTARKVWQTPEARVATGDLTDAMRARAGTVLAPVYAAVRARFGDRVPPEWAGQEAAVHRVA